MNAPLLLDLTHTSHTGARTGIQRVTRSLHASLGSRAVAICHDPYARVWRQLNAAEHATLGSKAAPGRRRSARWTAGARVRGRLQALFGPGNGTGIRIDSGLLEGGLLVPELFSPGVAAALQSLAHAVRGPRVALFHDSIALKLPEISPQRTVARTPAYLVELLRFDAIAATSEASRAMLEDYWRWLGASPTPPVAVIGLGVDPAPASPAPIPEGPPVILSVGTIEGRKNHVALLDAAESLWREGFRFSLRLVGLVQTETGLSAHERIRRLQAAGRPLRHDGAVRDETVEAAYAACHFTVYPSLIEGFGLPVIESLARGRPCVCSARGAIGESAEGGGCLTVRSPDAASLAGAMRTLLQSPAKLAALAAEARGRRFRSWAAYSDELVAWMGTVRRRDPA